MPIQVITKIATSLLLALVLLPLSACSPIQAAPATQSVEPAPVVPVSTAIQATPSAESSPSAPQPLVWYDFEGNFLASGIVQDRSGNGYDAQVTRTVATTRGISGLQAIAFSGNGYIQAQSNPVAGRNELSFSLWFNTGQPQASQKLASGAWQEEGTGSGWVLATDLPRFWGPDGHSLDLPDLGNAENSLTANAWVNQVVTYGGGHLREYRDGTLVNDWPTTDAVLGDGNNLVVGGWPDGLSYFDGAIDDFKIYALALSPEQVWELYSQTVMASHQLLPVPPAGSMFFPSECLTRQPGIDYWRYEWLGVKGLGGCSYIAPSPDGQTLAYAALACITAVDCGEVVRLLQAGSRQPRLALFIDNREKQWVGALDWSANGELVVVLDDINQPVGTEVITLPADPGQEALVQAKVFGGLAGWNASRSAFVTYWGAGPGGCGSLVSGYDFTTGQIFPDIALSLGLDPYDLIVQSGSYTHPSNWWAGEDRIPLLITPLEFDEQRQDYKYMPTLAGMITLTASGPVYATLASSASEDFSFVQTAEGYALSSKPYEIRYCFDQ